MTLQKISYKIHKNTYLNTDLANEFSVYQYWFENPTVDLWRHLRMLSVLDPFLNHDTQARWLTVGDGRFGTSATYIHRKGSNALPTDIDTRLLQVAKDKKIIPDFAFANAESLPFEDDTFNYCYCKQSYHHFPRPIIAVYEMLRVANSAVILTEPHDFSPPPIFRNIIQNVKHSTKRLFGLRNLHHDFGNYEAEGNYIYSISVREFEKIALGIGLPALAYKKFSDVYIPGVEHESLAEHGPYFKRVQRAIKLNRLKSTLKIADPNTIQMILFKRQAPNRILEQLRKDGYTIVQLPKSHLESINLTK